MTCRLILACIYLLVQAKAQGLANDRQKLGLASTIRGSIMTSNLSTSPHIDSTQQALRKKLANQLYSIEQVTAHVHENKYTRSSPVGRTFTGTIDAEVTVSEHSEKYSDIVVKNADGSKIKRYTTMVKVPPPWSSNELTAPMLIVRNEIMHAKVAPIADLLDNGPMLMLEFKVPRSNHELFVRLCGLKVYSDYTLRVWFDANSGNLR